MNYAQQFKQYSTLEQSSSIQIMTVVAVISGGYVRLESNGKLLTTLGNYRIGDRVYVVGGNIVGFANLPDGEYLV